MEDREVNPKFLSFTSILTLIFITLRLCGVIDWSWLWVLSPLWISGAIVITLAIIITIYEERR